jgi:hypothetical protein
MKWMGGFNAVMCWVTRILFSFLCSSLQARSASEGAVMAQLRVVGAGRPRPEASCLHPPATAGGADPSPTLSH